MTEFVLGRRGDSDSGSSISVDSLEKKRREEKEK
jgi:hypothetical protein